MSNDLKLRALGFCGADDSVDPRQLGMFSNSYPLVEFGVLFRPDKEGQPRYATKAWVERLAVVSGGKMKLAAHLCGAQLDGVLEGDKAGFLDQLESWGFQRVQINATAVNGTDTSNLAKYVESFLAAVMKHPKLEFILQKNEETQPLWKGILDNDIASEGEGENVAKKKKGFLPSNMSMLVDESKGTGVLASSWPKPPAEYEIGYAGGIGPNNIETTLKDVAIASNGRPVWVDMESSLRSTKNGDDVFDLDKCYRVIVAACEAGAMKHPEFLS